ncbi:MAG TPA: hypothetical protein EYQ25_14190 [Planctomycetes bacterium]|nr:hypothetical protein [Planctomycetota bacterium]HIL36611.1 hypothetical protein [Planctomycetota bacterium]
MIQPLLLILALLPSTELTSAPSDFTPVGLDSMAVCVSESVRSQEGRVLVLGFDGADYRTTRRLIDEGQLPNLKALAADGTFAPLHSTNPAESAAGWAAINTGQNPAKNGVASFINRKIIGNSPFPGVAHITQERNVPVEELMKRLEARGDKIGGVLGFVLGKSATELALFAGLSVVLVVFVLLGLVLRVGRGLSAVLALVIGILGGYAAMSAKDDVPLDVPLIYRNNVRVAGFWDYAGEAGAPALVLDAALAFDRPHAKNTRVLGGLGLPDVRGGISGEWFIYSSDDIWFDPGPKGERAGSTGSGTIFQLAADGDGIYKSFVWGPTDLHKRSLAMRSRQTAEEGLTEKGLSWKDSQKLQDEKRAASDLLDGMTKKPWESRTRLPLMVEPLEGGARITIGNQAQDVQQGSWSDWYRLTFEMGPLLTVNALTRVKLEQAEDPLTLYMDSLAIDPSEPPFWQPISQPRGFSRELEGWLGNPFETLGWACMTNQMKDERIDAQTFLEDIEFTMEWRRRLLKRAIDQDDWRLLFSVFSITDRVQHILYVHADPEHPMHDPQEAQRIVRFFGRDMPLSECIEEVYRQMDARVGEVMQRLEPNDTLMLCADHGFTSFRRQMDVNGWLIQEGFLTLKDGVSTRDGSGGFGYVDWTRTKAYSLGLGMIYLNLEGREPLGIVPPGDARAVLEDIAARAVVATDGGNSVVLDAEIVWDKYPGEWQSMDYPCSDLMLGFDEFYRAGWNTVSGGVRLMERDGEVGPGPIYRDNTNPWSGDHAGNSPNLVTGIFFCNQKVSVPEDGVSVLHIAPTVLDVLGVPVPAEFDLDPLRR